MKGALLALAGLTSSLGVSAVAAPFDTGRGLVQGAPTLAAIDGPLARNVEGTKFGRSRIQSLAPGAVDATWMRLDGDQDFDLAVATGDRLVRLFVGDGSGGFREVESAVDPALARGTGFKLAAGDLDRDGRTDLVACGGSGHGGICRVFLNRTGREGPVRLEPAAAFPQDTGSVLPLLADFDGDGDLDLLLLAAGSRAGHSVVRNDDGEDGFSLNSLPREAMRGGAVRKAAVLDRGLRGVEILLARDSDAIDDDAGGTQLVAFDRDRQRFQKVAVGPGFSAGGGAIAVADFDGNGEPDIFVARPARSSLWLRRQDGSFRDAGEASGLAGAGAGAALALAEDFDRDGNVDLLLARADGSARILSGSRERDGSLRFSAASGALTLPRAPRALALARTPQVCDFSLDLVAVGADGTAPALLHFDDASAAHTITPGSDGRARATRGHTCADGTEGNDRLEGGPRGSVLRGGRGDDTLVALGGVTVMRGGPGADRFEARDLTIIRLPPDDVDPRKVIACDPQGQVIVDSPLSLEQLQRAGIGFENCFLPLDCRRTEPSSEDGEDVDCHTRSSLVVSDLGQFTRDAPFDFSLLQEALLFKLTPFYDGPGVGTCHDFEECHALGLEMCQTEDGMLVDGGFSSPPAGQCYPGDQDDLVDPIFNWCDDPYFARNRRQEIASAVGFSKKRYVVPMIVWVLRSSAALSTGACTIPGKSGVNSLKVIHDGIAAMMNAVIGSYGKEGITFDYRIRIKTVSASGAFVDQDQPCRTKLAYAENDPNQQWDADHPNRVEDFVDSMDPRPYVDNQINAYIVDVGGWGESSSFKLNGQAKPFILLHGGMSAIGHELAHALHNGHPWDNNLTATNANPASESRVNFVHRPFPDQPTQGLQLCHDDGDCSGTDLPPDGLFPEPKCLFAPNHAFGYCDNLKRDCALSGDHVCDTFWDTRPCFTGQDFYMKPCDTDADCTSPGFFGTPELFRCGFTHRCIPWQCTGPADCASGMCIGGRCANDFTAVAPNAATCCDAHADRAPGKNHTTCWEKGANSVFPVNGPGTPPSTWPGVTIALAYHPGVTGVPNTFTPGQRDHMVCNIGYELRYGPIFREGKPDGAPCSLLGGATPATYGNMFTSAKVAHGACASGVCQVSFSASLSPPALATSAVCVASTCSDGVTGPDEGGIDCGGVCPAKCGIGSSCRADTDCKSNSCFRGRCQPSCGDGEQDGTELATDQGGSGLEPGCGGRALGQTCRFDDDCAGNLKCIEAGNCVDSSECAGNSVGIFESTCTSNLDCAGGTCMTKYDVHCANKTCAADSDCASGRCDVAGGKCFCNQSSDCPDPGDACQIVNGACTNECRDGRCLGRCEPIIHIEAARTR